MTTYREHFYFHPQGDIDPPAKAPPCERPVAPHMQHTHPRYPSGTCTYCGAEPHEGCLHDDYEAWEKEQTS